MLNRRLRRYANIAFQWSHDLCPSNDPKNNIVVKMALWDHKTRTWGLYS